MSLGFKKNITLFEANSFAALAGFFLLALCGFVLFSNNATAKNWNTGKSSGKAFDYYEIETRSVPRSFPEYGLNLEETCVTSNGNWNVTHYASFNNDFLWIAYHSVNASRIYTGKRANRNLFVINVTEASSKWRDNPIWIQYRAKGNDIVASLKQGIKGRYDSPGRTYWRECTLKLYTHLEGDRVKNLTDASAQIRALERLEHTQITTLKRFYDHGVQREYRYDFQRAANNIEASSFAVAEERRKAEVELALKRSKEEARLAKLQKEAALLLKKKQDERIAESEIYQKKVDEELKQAEVLFAKKKAEEIARLKAVEEARRNVH